MNFPNNCYHPTENKKIAEGIYKTSIDGLLYIMHKTFADERGFFSEIARLPELEVITGKSFHVKQINHARSLTNVIRGIHAEGWNKYITIASGICFSAIADVRPHSTTFGNKEYFILGNSEGSLDGSLYIPSGAGNSMAVIDGPVDYIYFVDCLYQDRDKEGDVAISLFDPDLAIEWPIAREDMIISERDINSINLREKYGEKVFTKKT